MARLVNPGYFPVRKHFHEFVRSVMVHGFYCRSYYFLHHPIENAKFLFQRKGQRNISGGELQCWKCGLKRSSTDIFCSRCNVLQKRNQYMNYFEIFNLKPTYELEQRDLTSNFRKLQNVLHPDRFVNCGEEERENSSEYSSFVNKAYKTLLQPLTRGLYMLELKGIHLEEGNMQSDPEFLMEIMERNEEVDQAKAYSEIASLDEKNKAVLETLTRTVAEAFRAGNLKEVTETLIKMKYYVRIDAKIKDLKLKTGIVE